MADYTPNLNLKKPLQEESYNIEDFNNNFSIIDSKIRTEADIARMFKDIVTNGVTDIVNDFPITYNGNMSVTIGPGVAWHNGHRMYLGGTTFDIDPVTDADDDGVLIVVEYDDSNDSQRMVMLRVAEPNIPSSSGVKLYSIQVTPSTTEITSQNVTDLRTKITSKI